MSGLVGYGSSDEEEDNATTTQAAPLALATSNKGGSIQANVKPKQDISPSDATHRHGIPQRSTAQTEPAARVDRADDGHVADGDSDGSQSPYSTERSLLRNLTLPTVPNLDIPGSPPGSPPRMMSEKVSRFLELKKSGAHFNEKLAASSSLKNPSLLSKLSASAGLSQDDQYSTSIPHELWNPQGFPVWAFKDELGRAQEKAEKIRSDEVRQGVRAGVEFVRPSKESLSHSRDTTSSRIENRRHEHRSRN